jgi:hypothetical protein
MVDSEIQIQQHRYLFWELHEIHEYTLRVKCKKKKFYVSVCRAYGDHWLSQFF